MSLWIKSKSHIVPLNKPIIEEIIRLREKYAIAKAYNPIVVNREV